MIPACSPGPLGPGHRALESGARTIVATSTQSITRIGRVALRERVAASDASGLWFDGHARTMPRMTDDPRAEIAELQARLRACSASLEAADKELDTLCYAISHDLRAPLRAVDGSRAC